MQFRCLYVAQIIAFITARKFRDCVKGSTLRQSQLRNPPVHRCFAGLRGAAAGIGGTAYNATNRTTKQTIAAPRPRPPLPGPYSMRLSLEAGKVIKSFPLSGPLNRSL